LGCRALLDCNHAGTSNAARDAAKTRRPATTAANAFSKHNNVHTPNAVPIVIEAMTGSALMTAPNTVEPN
jgi:hypothetical protein